MSELRAVLDDVARRAADYRGRVGEAAVHPGGDAMAAVLAGLGELRDDPTDAGRWWPSSLPPSSRRWWPRPGRGISAS